MSAADELERMATELEKLEDAQDFGPMFERGIAEGLRRARVLLEGRASELRNAAHVSLKPDRVEAGQVWSFRERRPVETDATWTDECVQLVTFTDGSGATASELLRDERWRYVGMSARGDGCEEPER